MYALDFLATISNCDAEGQLKLCSALQMMQDSSEMWIDSEPVLKRFFDERGSTQLLVSRQVEIVRVPACKERLTVATSVFGMRPKFGDELVPTIHTAGTERVVVLSLAGRTSAIVEFSGE